MPVDDVELYCDSCGSPTGHTSTPADSNGVYSFSWAQNGVHPLLVWKAGYDVIDPMGTLRTGEAYENVTVNGDTRFDIQLVRK